MKEIDVIEQLQMLTVFDSRDYAETANAAWLYGIIIGWDTESLMVLVRKFEFTDEQIGRMNRLHNEFVALCKTKPPEYIIPWKAT